MSDSFPKFNRFSFHLALALLAAAMVSPLHADMALTPAGVGDGFTLSTYASGFPNNGAVGPVGITFESGGQVMVSSYANGLIDVFATDTDGQIYSGGTLSATNYGGGNPAGLATTGGKFYLAEQGSGAVVEVDANGNFVQTIVTGVPAATGIIADPINGHLFVSTLGNNVIWDVDPIAKTKTAFVFESADGLTIAPDGSVLYAEVGGHILGFNTTTKVQVFDSGPISGVDGTAIGFGSLAGNIFANTNFGQLVEVNLTTDVQTVIGTGGSRGDLVSVDPNGSLLLTQTSTVLRLTPSSGGSFTPIPEPSTLLMLGTGLLGLGGSIKRKFFS